MTLPSRERIATLLAPYVAQVPDSILEKLEAYLSLLLKWNQKTNLTAVRDPEQLIQRQMGESLLAGQLLQGDETLLDFGTGAGFPGIPLKLLLPDLKVTLAESQGKKASFLREAVRTLGLDAEVWSGRVEALPASRTYDVVAMRAVDHTEAMLPLAEVRVREGGSLLRYLAAEGSDASELWQMEQSLEIPFSTGRISLWKRANRTVSGEIR
jgi:16S rRNA (guanine527-N7)-methyltransferase